MLKNKGAAISLKFNGITIDVPEGGLVDVRDFDVSRGQTQDIRTVIKVVERQITRKNPGQFDIVEHTDNVQIDKQYRGEIEELKSKVAELTQALSAAQKTNEAQNKKVSELADEVNAFGTKESAYKSQISKLKAELSEQDSEHKAHVKRLTGGR